MGCEFHGSDGWILIPQRSCFRFRFMESSVEGQRGVWIDIVLKYIKNGNV